MSEFYTVVTQKGIDELKTCLSTNKAFGAVYMGIGDSLGSYYEPEETQTALKNELYRGNIYAKGKKDNYIYFDLQIPQSEGDYVIREVGLFDSENNLLAVSKYPETLKTKATSDNETILNIEIQIELSTQAINTIIIEDTGNLVTFETLEEYFNRIQIASHTKAGIVKIGENVYVDDEGTISVKQTSGFQLFDVVYKDHILSYEESEGLTLQGDFAYCEAEEGIHFGYSDFYNKCIEERNNATDTRTVLDNQSLITWNHQNGHIYFDIKDKAIVDAYFNNHGVAWFFGIDEEQGRILMPRNIYFMRNSMNNPGGLNLPGAPTIEHYHTMSSQNITGSTYILKPQGGTTSGAFSLSGSAQYGLDGGGINFESRRLSLNVSLSGSISKNSSVNEIYGREQNQVMVTSSNMLLYIVTGTVIRDYADIICAELDNAKAQIRTETRNDIEAVTLAGVSIINEIENAQNSAVEVVVQEGETQINNIKEQADIAREQAQTAEYYASVAVAGQIQADWEQNNTNSVDFIKNKPEIITKDDVRDIIQNSIEITNTTETVYYTFYEDEWIEKDGLYEYRNYDLTTAWSVYRNENGIKKLVFNVDLTIDDDGIILTSLVPFDGCVLGNTTTINEYSYNEEDEDDNEFTDEEWESLIIKDFEEF